MKKLKIFKSEIRNPKSELGLTLIEVMIVVAILAVISSTIFSVFQGSLLSQRRGTNKALIYSEARAALDMMSREIEKAMVDERVPIECWGVDGGGDAPDTFLFIAPLNPDKKKDAGHINNSELCEVGYWVENKDLMKGWSTGSNDFDLDINDFGSKDALIGNVFNLQFVYIDKLGNMLDAWNEDIVYTNGFIDPVDVLPKAIKITLVLEYEPEKDQIRQDTFITVVNIPGSGQ